MRYSRVPWLPAASPVDANSSVPDDIVPSLIAVAGAGLFECSCRSPSRSASIRACGRRPSEACRDISCCIATSGSSGRPAFTSPTCRRSACSAGRRPRWPGSTCSRLRPRRWLLFAIVRRLSRHDRRGARSGAVRGADDAGMAVPARRVPRTQRVRNVHRRLRRAGGVVRGRIPRRVAEPPVAVGVGLFAGAAVVFKPNAGLYLPALLSVDVAAIVRRRSRALLGSSAHARCLPVLQRRRACAHVLWLWQTRSHWRCARRGAGLQPLLRVAGTQLETGMRSTFPRRSGCA